MQLLRSSLRESRDQDLIRKAINSVQVQKPDQTRPKNIASQSNHHSNPTHKDKQYRYQSDNQKEDVTQRRIISMTPKGGLNHQVNPSNNQEKYHSQHSHQLSLLSISQKCIDQDSSRGKKRNAIYLRKSSQKSKNVKLNPIKTQEVEDKGTGDKKKVFYLSINRSPFEKYDNKSENLYHLPDFVERDHASLNSKASCTLRYLNECISKSTHKPIRLNLSLSHEERALESQIIERPAPVPIKYKYNKQRDANTVFNTIHNYVMTRKMRDELEKSLMVESKKQELLKNNAQRHKVEAIRRKYMLKTSLDRKAQSEEKQKGHQEQFKRQSNYRFVVKKPLLPSPKHCQGEKSQKQLKDFLASKQTKQKISIYDQKIMVYRQLLFLVNMAHGVFDPIALVDPLQKEVPAKYRYYIGPGNNSKLVRALMKRRHWWTECSDPIEADFCWTQLKVPAIYQRQQQRVPTKRVCQDASIERVKSIVEVKLSQNIVKQYIFKPPFAARGSAKILTAPDSALYNAFVNASSLNQFEQFHSRIKYFPEHFFSVERSESNVVHNHLQFNHCLGNKKALFYHLTLYYKITGKPSSTAIPQTYHIKSLENDHNYQDFLTQFSRLSKNKAIQNIWIVKPGENSNRGTGIDVFNDVRRLRFLAKEEKYKNGQPKTYIIQKYIERPLLYQGRKFDIRHYMVITALHGQLRAYWYGEGYVRTSSEPFSLHELEDSMIHLTNDAIQKQGSRYGAHEQGNKVSYMELQRHFDKHYPFRHFDFKAVYVRMRQLAQDALAATYLSLAHSRRLHNFEVLGLDFMIDDHMKVHLIEINTNPCLEISSALLGRIIPLMLEQTLRLSLDALFPPNLHYNNNSKSLAPDCSLDKLQMELIFDEAQEGERLESLYAAHREEYRQMMMMSMTSNEEDDETFDNEGDNVEIDKFIT